MDVEYTLDMDNVLAFSRYHNAHSPAIRRRLMISRLVVADRLRGHVVGAFRESATRLPGW